MTPTQKRQVAYTLRNLGDEVRRLRRDNQIMGEKLNLVEGLLELRHLRGPSIGMGEDQTYEGEKIAAVLEMEAGREDTGKAEGSA